MIKNEEEDQAILTSKSSVLLLPDPFLPDPQFTTLAVVLIHGIHLFFILFPTVADCALYFLTFGLIGAFGIFAGQVSIFGST